MKEIDIDRIHTVLTRLFLVVCCGVLATACVKDPQKGEDTPDGGESASKYFSYATTREYTVAIDYGFSDYQVLFEIYGGNPLAEVDGGLVKTSEEPLYRAATDKKGCFSGTVTLPADLTEVYLYSDYPGTVSPVKLTVGENGAIAYDQKQVRSRAGNPLTRALITTPTGTAYPDRYKVLGNWSKNGRPDYLLDPADLTAQQYYDVKSMFNLWGGQHIKDFPQRELIADNVNIKLNITKATTIKLIFIKTTATMRNVFGYYTYPTGQEPKSVSDIHVQLQYRQCRRGFYRRPGATQILECQDAAVRRRIPGRSQYRVVPRRLFVRSYDRDGTGGQYSCLLCFTRVESEQHAPFDRAGRPAERTYAGDRFRGQRYHRGG